MKKSIICIVCVILCMNVFTQTGVYFENLSFEKALAKAKAEKKWVFIDCYTSWCGPCKTMLNNVFPVKEVGDILNTRCVNIKFDMEVGEGKILAEKYGVKSFPTFLIFNPDGSLQYRALGGAQVEDFLVKIQRWLDPKSSLTNLEKRYAAGKLKPSQQIAYLLALKDNFKKEEIEKLYAEWAGKWKEKDKLSRNYWYLQSDVKYSDEEFQFLIRHVDTYVKLIGEKRVYHFLFYKFLAVTSQMVGRYVEKNPEVRKKYRSELFELKKDVESLPGLADSLRLHRDICLALGGLDENMGEVLQFLRENEFGDDMHSTYFRSMGVRMVLNNGTEKEKEQLLSLKDRIGGKGEFDPASNLLDELEKEFAQVRFRDMPFEQALQQAKAENKLIFVDCYTTWCGPCKFMAANVLTEKSVGDILNPVCLCVKYDMDKKELKTALAKYGVRAFPTFLIIRPDGSLQHKIVGSSETEDFIVKLKQGLSEKTCLSYLQNQYNAGKCNKEQMLDYWLAVGDSFDKNLAKKVGLELYNMLTDEERVQAQYWPLLSSKDQCEYHDFILKHIDVLKRNVGNEVEKFMLKEYTSMMQHFFYSYKCGQLKDEKQARNMLKKVRQEVITCNFTKPNNLLLQMDWAEKMLDKKVVDIEKYLKNVTTVEENDLSFLSALYSVMSKYGSKAALERLQDFKAKKDKAVEDYTRKYFSF